MKSVLSALLVLGSVSATAEVKRFGTVVPESCGNPTKTHTVCTAHAVGTRQAYLTVSTVKTKLELPATARVIGPSLVLWKATKGQKTYELIVNTSQAGKQLGTYKIEGSVVGMSQFSFYPVMHTM